MFQTTNQIINYSQLLSSGIISDDYLLYHDCMIIYYVYTVELLISGGI